MYKYVCCGLRMETEVQIPELRVWEGQDPDVVVRHAPIEPPAAAREAQGLVVQQVAPGELVFWVDDVGGLRVREGKEILMCPRDGAWARGFRFLILGVGMGGLLHQRGLSSLHASAVEVGNGAVAFVGGKGMGKSTTAAAFHEAGYAIVTDDLLPFQVTDDGVQVLPAHPSVKLHSDSLQAVLATEPEAYPRVDARREKRTTTLAQGVAEGECSLRAVYVLDWATGGGALESCAVEGQRACMELLRNAFALRILGADTGSELPLDRIAQLAARVPVRRLVRPVDLSRTDEIPAFVCEDLERDPEPRARPETSNR